MEGQGRTERDREMALRDCVDDAWPDMAIGFGTSGRGGEAKMRMIYLMVGETPVRDRILFQLSLSPSSLASPLPSGNPSFHNGPCLRLHDLSLARTIGFNYSRSAEHEFDTRNCGGCDLR